MTLSAGLEELRTLAQAATPGPWTAGGVYRSGRESGGRVVAWPRPDDPGLGDYIATEVERLTDAAFIAAADPSVVAALTEAVQGIEQKRLDDELCPLCRTATDWGHMPDCALARLAGLLQKEPA